MGWLDSDSLGFWDVAIPFYGATHAAAIGGKKVVDAAKGADLTGSGGGTPPSYNPDPNNFSYGLGQYIDAQGVVHPTPEERAQMAAQAQQQNQAAQLELDKKMGELPEGSPERHELEKQMLALINEGEAQQEQIASFGGQDNYAAQRTREAVAKQQELAALRGNLLGRADEAYNRDAPQMAGVTSNGQSYLQGADAGSRAEQLAALGGLKDFANREQGPSAAQAQLQAGVDMAARQQYGMARSQPGGGGAALRNAAFNAAGISGNAGNSAAILRAQEDQAYRQQQLAALGAVQQGASGLRAGDQSFAQTQAGQANFDAQLGLTTQQQNLQAQLASRQQNDAAALGFTGQGLGLIGASQQYDSQRDALAANQSAVGTNFEGAKAASAGQQFNAQQAQQAQSNRREDQLIGMGSAALGYAAMASDVRAKKDIDRVDMLKALGGAPSHASYPTPTQPDTGALDAAYAREGGAPNLRPAQGYEYSYRDPEADGAGRYVGPMAQNLEHLPGVVQEGPGGKKSIDPGRLTLVNTAAVSEQQRRLDQLQAQLAALSGSRAPMPATRQPDYMALDQAAGRR